MALVYENGRPYYYRNKRQNGTVVREYIASGHLAELAAEKDALKRAEQQAKRTAVAKEQTMFAAARTPLLDLTVEADLLIQAMLLDAGYHRQNRGPWRRKLK